MCMNILAFPALCLRRLNRYLSVLEDFLFLSNPLDGNLPITVIIAIIIEGENHPESALYHLAGARGLTDESTASA